MYIYNYKERKKIVEEILSSSTEIETKKVFPNPEDSLSYSKGFKAWVGAMFVDIVDSSSLFKEENEKVVAKIMKAFCNELIEILRHNDNYKEIGIRGDCVYAIYSAHNQEDLLSILDDAIMINTFIGMFKKMLEKRNLPSFKIGIGLGASEDLIIKAGEKGTGISNTIWIGSAVVNASKLSSEANREMSDPIVMDGTFYHNIKDHNATEEKDYSFFSSQKFSTKLNEVVYSMNMVYTNFNDWVNTEL